MISEAFILAGGLGTRLKTVVFDKPKPMADIAGRPFLEYLLEYWICQGIRKFTLLTGHLGGVIKEHFGNSFKGCDICYVDEVKPLGTGGAIRNALANQKKFDQNLLVINGDTWFEARLDLLCTTRLKTGTPITICCKKIDLNSRYGGLKLDENNLVTEFGLSHEQSSIINGWCYLINNFLNSYLANYPDFFYLKKILCQVLLPKVKSAVVFRMAFLLTLGFPRIICFLKVLFRKESKIL